MYIKYILHVKIIYRKWNIIILPWIQQTEYVLIKKKEVFPQLNLIVSKITL